MTRRKIVGLYLYDGQAPPVPMFAEWRDATQPVEVAMMLAAKFVKASKRGSSWECLLAEAIKELAAKSPRHFPHPVLYVHVLGSVLYIVAKLAMRPGQFHQAIRYDHNFRGTLRKFDQYTTRQFLRQFEGKDIVVQLKPPRSHGRPGVPGVTPHPSSHRTPSISRGALRRALDAHLIPHAPVQVLAR